MRFSVAKKKASSFQDSIDSLFVQKDSFVRRILHPGRNTLSMALFEYIFLKPMGPFSIRILFDSVLFLACAASFSLLSARMFFTGTDGYFFLSWNLVLAAVPYGLALFWDRVSHRESASAWKESGIFLLWLFFFPNAPYIVTDFIHVPWAYPNSSRFAFDFLLVASFAVSGMLFGLGSLFHVHAALRDRIGRTFAGIVVAFSISLAGIGMYLGRFLRWNSWDVLLNPLRVLRDAALRYGDPAWFEHAAALSILFAAFIGVSYGMFLGMRRLLSKLER